MNNTKANLWLFKKKTKDITFSYETKQKFRFIKGSLIAVVLGLIVGGIIIAIQNVNPFEYLAWLFKIGFNDIFTDRTISWLCIYIIAALAVGIGFKAGMFNIGVAGQMMTGGGLGIIFYKMVIDKPNVTFNAGYVIVIFLICIASGALMAAIAGALKALFNIHEVVTTIMLNWTTWYLMKFLFTRFADKLGGQGIQASGQIPGGSMNIAGSSIVIPIILAAIAVIVVSILLAKSTFGFKLRSVGASPSASKYAGYSVKSKMIEAMAISGLLAGVASFISIFTIAPQYTFNVDSLPTVGYDSIAITLVAFNNPIGTVFSSFLWAVLQSAGSGAASMFNLPTQMSQLIFGVIVYFAAISVVFINWYPIIKLKIMIALSGSKADQIKVKNLRKEQLKYRGQLFNINSSKDVQDYKKFINEQIQKQNALLATAKSEKQKSEIKQNIKSLKNDMNFFVKEYKKNLKEMIKKCSEQIKNIKKDTYVEKINSAKEGINKREFERIQTIEENALSKTSLLKSNVLSLKDTYKKDLKAKKNWLRDKLKELKKEYKFKRTQNDVWLESETGIKNHYWEMRNGKIESKAKINKIKIDAHNEILNIKSDHQMEVLALRSQYRDKPEILSKKEAVLDKKLNDQIKAIKDNERKQISLEKEIVKGLINTYKHTKAANESMAKQILADKESTRIKLAKNIRRQQKETKIFVKGENEILKSELKSLSDLIADSINGSVNLDEYKGVLLNLENDLRDKNKAFSKTLSDQLAIKKALVDESGRLLKQLSVQNNADIKAIAKINDHNNAEGASLVDIRLAYNQRNQRLDEWYAQQKQYLIQVDHDVKNLAKPGVSQANYEKISSAIDSFKGEIKKLGHNNDLQTIGKKQAMLKQLVAKIKKVWDEEYSTVDNNKWTKCRYRTYLWINNEQAKLNKLGTVINAENQIKFVKQQTKYINKMYKENIKQYRAQYLDNKKVDVATAQQQYRSQIEKFIHGLETQSFKSLKEVK